MNFLGRVFCSNPASFLFGMGVGLVGFYMLHRVDERRKMESMQKEIEGVAQALESNRLKVVEEEKKKQSASSKTNK